MTLLSSADIGFMLLGGTNILGVVTDVNDTQEQILEESTPLGANTDQWAAVGQSMWKLTQDGFFDSGAVNLAQKNALLVATPLLLAYGNAIGDDFVGGTVIEQKYTKGPARGKLTRAQAEYVASLGPERGIIAATHIARITTGPTQTTSYDWGIAYANQATGKMVAYLAVSNLNLDGGTNLAVKVRDSDDNITFADVITFATVTVAPSSERISLAAAAPTNDIERYTQVQHTFSGAPGGNKTATFAVGISRSLT